MKKHGLNALALAGLLFASSTAWASPEAQPAPAPRPDKQVHKRVIVVDKDGKEHVYDSEGTRVRRGYLGVGLTEMTPELRAHFGVPEEAGVMVSSVEDGSPADKAGLKVGDIIAALDGKDVKSSWDVRSQIRDLKEGEQVPITIYRDGKAQNLSAAIALRERPQLDMSPLFFRGEGDGPTLFNLDPEKMQELKELRLERRTPAPGMPRMRSPRELELEKRLAELEKRLADLEKMLEKK
jgi:membrane-associated protease RseP (regulator of RpoE activity)